MKKLFSLLLLSAALFLSAKVQAQCTLAQQSFNALNAMTNAKVGQSFIAPCSGNLSEVTITLGGAFVNTPFDLYVYLGDGFSGPLLHRQTVVVPGPGSISW